MSGTEARKTSGSGRREARALQESKEKRKIKLTATIVIVVMVLLFLGALFINSKYIRRLMTAVTIEGVKFSAAEFDYYYNNAVYEYSSIMSEQMGDYASEYLPTNDRPHSSQIKDEETGETWASFFGMIAMERLSELVSYHKDAERNGYVMTEETRNNVEEEVASLKATAEMYGGQYSNFNTFLQEFYGASINEKTFRKIAEFIDTAAAYAEHVHDSFTYTPQSLKDYYAEKKDSLDIISYRYFLITAESVDESEFDSTDEYETAKETALTDALEKAAEVAESIESEEDFIAAAREYNEDAYEDEDSTFYKTMGENLSASLRPWLIEAEREHADATAIEMTTGAYVVLFVSRDDNNYPMVEMRQLLFLREDTDPEDFYEYDEIDPEEFFFDEDAYDQAVELRDGLARARAYEAYDIFVAGGATEAKLLEMLEEYSDDETEGGFYNQITTYEYQNKLVPEIEEWLFDPERQVGDYEMIKTEDFGYHLIYFTGYGELFCDSIAESRMRESDYNEWKENLPAPESEERWGMILTQRRGRS